LIETIRQFTESFNAICRVAWKKREGNAYKLHYIVYRGCKNTLPDLVSDLHVQAIHKASEAIKATITRSKKEKKTSCPQSKSCPPRYERHTFKIYWDKGLISMSSTNGRLKIPFTIPEYAKYAIDCPTSTADLIKRKGRFYLHVVVKLPDVDFIDNGKAIGVDLGVTRPAVTSDNRFHGKRHWKEVVKRTFRLKRDLQSNGSKSAKRHLRRLAGREQRFRRDCDHVISASILKDIQPGTTVVVENLTNIRTRCKASRGEAKRRLHSWSFAQLKGFLEYKAEAKGCQIVAIDPRHTSQRCNRCGFTYRGNRKSQSEFLCRQCGFKHNADLNASKNIRDKYLVGWTTCPSDAPLSPDVSFPQLLVERNNLIVSTISSVT
jgi:IS605 OrfB family transposase